MGSRKAVPWLLPFFAGLPLTAAQPSPTAQAWNLLHTGASDSKPEVRQQAAAALGSMTGIGEAIGLLEKLLSQDEEADVRQTAAAGLGAMKARTAIPYLKDAIDDPDRGVSYAAVRSLWDMGDLSGRQNLEAILSKHRGTSTGGLHKQIEAAKREMHSPAALARITLDNASGAILGPFAIGYGPAKALLNDSGATSRAFAADLLSRHCDNESRQVLEERMAAEGNLGVKTAIARALAQCGDKQALPILEAYMADSRDALKFMAAASVIRLNQSKTAPAKTIKKKRRPAPRPHSSSSSPPGKPSSTP